jgi:DegV family protein with EDD domain
MTIRIITDSTCDLPEELARTWAITVVPAYINIGSRSYLDGIELSRQAFYEGLPGYPEVPTTAAPSSGTFTEVYEKVTHEGATEILSIHVAGDLSGMLNAARLGADAADSAPVTLFDSKQVSMGLGLQAIIAAEAAAKGHSMAEIIALLDQVVERTYVFAVLDTLEYLRRSGRVSWARFGIGTLLRIKPLIRVHLGQVELPEKIRTSSKAVQRMLEMVEGLGPLEKVALLHTHSEDKLAGFLTQCQHLIPAGSTPPTVEVTPAIGAHVGTGAMGIACVVADKPTED